MNKTNQYTNILEALTTFLQKLLSGEGVGILQMFTEPRKHLVHIRMGVTNRKERDVDFLEHAGVTQRKQICHDMFVFVVATRKKY